MTVKSHSEDGEGQNSEQTILTKDDAFHLLQNSRRRAVLRYMFDNGADQFVMRDLAKTVAAWENDTTKEQLTSKERQRVYISLYQSHLPKMAEYGIIDYNQNRGFVTLLPLAWVLEPLLGDSLTAPQIVREPENPQEADSQAGGLLSWLGLAK